jgi:hypothetical protein
MSAHRGDGLALAAVSARIVTPAKAGVHAWTSRAVARWTPAFAGVTSGATARRLFLSRRSRLLRSGAGQAPFRDDAPAIADVGAAAAESPLNSL